MHQFRDHPRHQTTWVLTAVVGTLLLLSACAAPRVQLTATGAPPTAAIQGEPYAGFSVEASGGVEPYTYSLQGAWPVGITIDAGGAVSGTPTDYGTFADLAVRVEDSNGATGSFELEAALKVLAAIPALSFEELPYWWATAPAAPLSEFSTLRLQFTTRNTSGVTLEFTGDAGGSDPLEELRLWFTPATFATSPTLRMDTFPEGSYVDGMTMTWDLTIELSSLAGASTGIAMRPYVSPLGNAGPSRLELVSFDLSVAR